MCIRIGSYFPQPTDRRMLSTWMSYRDFTQLIQVSLGADYHFEIVYGVTPTAWDSGPRTTPKTGRRLWRTRSPKTRLPSCSRAAALPARALPASSTGSTEAVEQAQTLQAGC